MKLVNLQNSDKKGSGQSKLKVIMGIGLFLLLCNQSSFGQSSRGFPGASSMRIEANSMKLFGGNVVNDPNKLNLSRKKTQIGSFYLCDDWKKADIYLVTDSSVIKGIETRIDLQRNELEVKYKGEVKVLPSFRIRSIVFNIDEDLFITECILKSSQKGFYKVLVDDENSLLCRYNTKIQPSNYNIQLDAGQKSSKIVKEQNYFIFKGADLIQLGKTKSKLKKQFNKRPKLYDFINQNKINPKNERSLVQFVDYLNNQKIQL
ncbi:hypothetical protein GQR60_09765 [Labilibaculum sp. A4]|uniref:hypothetical protein n=1 Tax=Labilibaculum euxinus TaxID=2686357 RepID=UPI000F61A089|nr:hypothetical protein [Labilibaculum euxinus]MDQ1771485.1 hypothetical protein [Labilibaculum euxinus]MWN76627.1 hypothetical protein [Labilibaculum euxinus]